MPSTYAHYRLGQQVRRELEGNERKIIEKYPQLYLIGLHGPDILFYYKPLRPNPVNQIGYDLHGHSGKEFFERAKNIINSQKEKEPFIYRQVEEQTLDQKYLLIFLLRSHWF